MPADEVQSIVGASLCEAAQRFNPELGVCFKTFFFYYLRGMLLKEISRLVHEKRLAESVADESDTNIYPSEGFYSSGWPFNVVELNNPEALLSKRQAFNLYLKACCALDSLEREVIVRHVVLEEPLRDVAQKLGYNRCHISRVKSGALEKLAKVLGAPVKSSRANPSSNEKKAAEAEVPAVRSYTGARGRTKAKSLEKKEDIFKRLIKQTGT